MKVKILFFFSFVLAPATLVQHGAKLPLSNNFDGLENSCCCIMCFAEKIFFYDNVYMFHHTMLVLNAFPFSHFRGVKFKNFLREHAPGLMLAHLK